MSPWASSLAIAWLLAVGPAAAADVVSEKPDAVSVTIYNSGHGSTADFTDKDNAPYMRAGGLAMITETRSVDLPAGPVEIQFRGVADTMIAQTAEIDGLPAVTTERNFDYDLLSPGSLVAKSIGRTVHRVRTDPKTGKSVTEDAVIRSGPDGVVLDFGDRVEALHCSGLPERLVFDRTPDGLTDRPTLSVRTDTPKAGRYTLKLSYIASALNWSADYVARVRPDGRTLDLTGFITLANFGDVSFVQSPTALVAGRLATTGEDEPIDLAARALATHCWPVGLRFKVRRPLARGADKAVGFTSVSPLTTEGSQDVQEVVVTGSRIDPRALGDYKLYPLPAPTTVAARQIKQVQFLDQQGVTFERYYSAAVVIWNNGLSDDDEESGAPEVRVRFMNTTAQGLGKPLPSGTLSLQAPDGHGGFVLAGESHVKDTPVGEPLDLMLGHALDLEFQRKITGLRDVWWSKTTHQMDLEVVAENHKPVSVDLEILSQFDSSDFVDPKLVRESDKHSMRYGNPRWLLTLKPGERRVLRYTLQFENRPSSP